MKLTKSIITGLIILILGVFWWLAWDNTVIYEGDSKAFNVEWVDNQWSVEIILQNGHKIQYTNSEFPPSQLFFDTWHIRETVVKYRWNLQYQVENISFTQCVT